jgi:hypothetical protein
LWAREYATYMIRKESVKENAEESEEMATGKP